MTTSHKRPFRVALLGYGTIGSAIHRLLEEHRDHILHATGRSVEVSAALVRDANRPRRGIAGARMELLDDPDQLFADRTPDLVCEALGGLEPARTLVLRSLRAGVPVVTANKQLIAHHGPELFAAAQDNDAQLRFEASVCGAIPIVRMLRESLVASRIDGLLGILNGTTNFVLSSMADSGASYADALTRAQELGYAEPDPSDDVEGRDAAAKLAILAGLAFHAVVPPEAVRVVGITGIAAADVAHGRVLGYAVKLVGRARRDGGQVLLDVAPMLVPTDHPLAAVGGATNAVLVRGTPFGELMVQGAGAGGPETASALAGDIVGVMGSEPSFLTRDPQSTTVEIGDPATHDDRFYVRMCVPDRPGVLASVAGRLGAEDVSIERVIQQRGAPGVATLVLVTHPTSGRALEAALTETERSELTVMPIIGDSA